MSEGFNTSGAVAAGVGIVLGAIGGTVPAARPLVLAFCAMVAVITGCYVLANYISPIPHPE